MFCTGCSYCVWSGMLDKCGGHGFFHIQGRSSPICALLGLLRPWKWRVYNAAKRGISLIKQYGVISNETWIVRNNIVINRKVAKGKLINIQSCIVRMYAGQVSPVSHSNKHTKLYSANVCGATVTCLPFYQVRQFRVLRTSCVPEIKKAWYKSKDNKPKKKFS